MDPINIPKDLQEPRVPRPGDQLGEFRILHLIGEGAMGKVYEARQESLQRRVALKVLPVGGSAGDGQAVTRFYREARAAARLTHPNIVPVYGFGVEQGSYYYAMEFVDGPSLHAVAHDKTSPLRDEKKIARYILQVAMALEVAHNQGVIHRDVKPANILVRTKDGQDQAAITDFGLARQERKKSITQAGALMGTPVYMAPEQARGDKVDHRIDVYALGVVLYECLTGQVPFQQKKLRELLIAITTAPPRPLREIRPELSADIEAITLKALSKDKDERYATAKDMADDLIRYFRGDIVAAREAGPVALALRQFKKHKIITGLSAAVVLLVLAWIIGNPYLMRSRTVGRAQERLAAAKTKLGEPLDRYREAARKLREAREARIGELYRLGPEGRVQSERASGQVTRAQFALERAEERLLAKPKGEGADAASVAEEGRGILDEVRALLPVEHPVAQEANGLTCELIRALLHRARRDGNEALAEVWQRELTALGGMDGAATIQLNVQTEPADAQVFLYTVESDPETGEWRLGESRDVGRTPLQPGPALPPGEYLVELLARDRLTVRVPFVARLGQEAEQIRLELPPANRIPKGFHYIPPSEFMAGGDQHAVRPLFRSPQPIWVGGFFLAANEVTVGSYLAYLESLPDDERRVPNEVQFLETPEGKLVAPQAFRDHPVTGVTKAEAEAFCAWRSRRDGVNYRLPTSVEWEKAARGPAGRIFPWGNGFSPKGDVLRSHMQQGPRPGKPTTRAVGKVRGDRSIYGIFDLGGNVSEWVDDSFGGNSDAVLRGGSWARAPEITRSASREPVSSAAFPSVAPRVGFRLAFD